MTALDEPAHVSHSLSDTDTRMRELQVAVLPVVDGDEVVGVIERRDVQKRRVAVADTPLTVRDVMSSTFAFCHDTDSLEEALAAADALHVEAVIVVDQNNLLVGFVMKKTLHEGSDIQAHGAPVAQHKVVTSGLSGSESAGRPKGYSVKPRVRG